MISFDEITDALLSENRSQQQVRSGLGFYPHQSILKHWVIAEMEPKRPAVTMGEPRSSSWPFFWRAVSPSQIWWEPMLAGHHTPRSQCSTLHQIIERPVKASRDIRISTCSTKMEVFGCTTVAAECILRQRLHIRRKERSLGKDAITDREKDGRSQWRSLL